MDKVSIINNTKSNFKRFELQYDEPDRIFNPGEVVNGRLILECNEAETGLEIILEWLGEARVQLSKQFNIFEKHSYMNGSQDLISSKCNNSSISAGHHEFLFAIRLPVHIPSSFNCIRPVASIEYKTIVTAKKHQTLFDEKIENEFFVRGTYDLTEHPDCLLPQEISQESQLCCNCCSSNSIGYVVKLEKTGFIPGESINFVAELFNRTRRSADVHVKFIILERKVFWAQGKNEQAEDRIVTEIPGPKLDSKNREIVQSFSYEIPYLMCNDSSASLLPYVHPTGLGGCRLIKVTYFFKVIMKVPCRDEKYSEHRIHIGTLSPVNSSSPPPLKTEVKVVAICTSRNPEKSVNLSANSCNY